MAGARALFDASTVDVAATGHSPFLKLTSGCTRYVLRIMRAPQRGGRYFNEPLKVDSDRR